MEATICDLCRQEGEFTEAIGWYTANDGKNYDVCEKHAKDADYVKMGFKIHLY